MGKSRYSDLRVNWRQDGIAAKEKLDMHVIVRVNDYDQYAIVSASAENPAKATLLHFDGPLKVQLFRSPGHFTRGAECKLGVSIVTKYPGVECVQISHEKGIPADVHPVVEIAVPAEAPDAKPRTIKAKLESRC